jgi:hypothetical protein
MDEDYQSRGVFHQLHLKPLRLGDEEDQAACKDLQMTLQQPR